MNSSARKCGECTLCCRLLPVAEIAKPAGQRCQQQRAKGCRVYGTSTFPVGCSVWSCMWLTDDSLQLPRPDRAGYVLDPSPEFIELEMHGVTERPTVSVLQVWIDPARPHAHRDPQFRAWLAARWESHDQVALVRYDSYFAIGLLPPGFTGAGWIEQAGKATTAHSPAQIREALR